MWLHIGKKKSQEPFAETLGSSTSARPAPLTISIAITGMDANAIIDAAEGLTAGAPVRHRKMAV